VGRQDNGAQRPVGRRTKAILLCDKTKSSNVGDHGGTSPTRERNEHSGASRGTSHLVLSLVYTLHIFLPDTYNSTLT